DGFRTDTLLVPDAGLAVLACANLHDTGLTLGAVLSITDALLGHAEEESWYDRVRPPTRAGQEAGPGADEHTSVAPAPPPAHPPADYAGTYLHPGYGEVVVADGPGGLEVRVGESALTCRHRHYDTWDLRYEPLGLDLTVTFFTDPDGKVTEAVLPMDAETGPARFRRAVTR
ncbi:MAG TPA: DUF3471 domain-containing protein, partial [Acidimicrobiales bacterium]|nr:DUF3471 domain-containing protein [Acidimicrobiales bacterium]